MKNYYEDLSIRYFNSKQEAKEVADIIISAENVKDIHAFDFVSAFDRYGTIWNDEKLYAYINEGLGEEGHITTVEELFKELPNVFFRLSTGLIIAYKY